jgi:hypothetical protein
MPTKIIGSIRFTPAKVLPGDCFLIEVLDPDGKPYGNAQVPFISIEGIPGASQYLQYFQPGTKTIVVTAQSAEGEEHQTSTVTVETLPEVPEAFKTNYAVTPHNYWAGVGMPILTVSRHLTVRHTAIFIVGRGTKIDKSKLTSGAHIINSEKFDIKVPTLTYLWNFGDGTGDIGSDVPYIKHNFEPALNFKDEFQQFHISVTFEGKTVKRTLAVHNSYIGIKNSHGILSPSVDSYDPARKLKDHYVGTMTVHNMDYVTITLTKRRYQAIAADKDVLAAFSPIETLETPIIIKPKTSVTLTVQVPVSAIPKGSVGYSVYYSGTSSSNNPVRVGGHFDIDVRHQDYGPSTLLASVQKQIVAANKTISPAVLSNIINVYSRPKNIDKIKSNPITSKINEDLGVTLNVTPEDAMNTAVPQPVPVIDGQNCDPDNLPGNIPANMVCQATAETKQVYTDGRFINGRKGDIILSPGGSGAIGGLLHQVNPAQRWDHSGLITQNYNQITHCTASDDRMMNPRYFEGSILGQPAPLRGIRTDIIKYGWPGVITQTAANAVGDPNAVQDSTEKYHDPENKDDLYTINAFSNQPVAGDGTSMWKLVQPTIVTADPMLETVQMRELMHKVADAAVAQTNKYHYRFYCYTDPTINEAAPGTGNTWPNGTLPAVCSSFVWKMVKGQGIHLQTLNATVSPDDLTADEKKQGAAVGPNTIDGLYLYTEKVRQKAANWLYNYFHDLVIGKLESVAGLGGDVINFVFKSAEHVSNEMLNTFANNSTVLDDTNTTWQQTGASNAVSPLNLTFWQDANKFNGAFGCYGYPETAIYREPRLDTVTVYKWKTVMLKGKLKGKVTANGAPVAKAYIELDENTFTYSDAVGNYEIDNVPYGSYILKATVQQNDTYLSAQPAANVDADIVTCDITLMGPPDLYRTIVITGNLNILWTYSWNGGITRDKLYNTFPVHMELKIGPYDTHAIGSITKNSNSATATLTITVDWLVDKSAVVNIVLTQDNQNIPLPNFNVPADKIHRINNLSGSSHNDSASVYLEIANKIQED